MRLNVKKIETLRLKKRIPVKEMAELLGVTKQAYYDIVKDGSTKLSTISAIAKVLKVKGKDLLLER